MDFLGIPGPARARPGARAAAPPAERARRAEAAAPRPDPTTGPERATHEQLAVLRRELNGLVAAWHHRTGQPHGVIHAALRKECGGPPPRSPTPTSSTPGSTRSGSGRARPADRPGEVEESPRQLHRGVRRTASRRQRITRCGTWVASAITVELADDARSCEHQVDDSLEVGVRAGHDAAHRSPAPVIVWASSTSGIVGEVGADGVVAAVRPGGSRGEERGHRVAERLRVELRPPPGDHAGRGQPVEPGLHGAAGDPQPRDASSTPTRGSAANRSSICGRARPWQRS